MQLSLHKVFRLYILIIPAMSLPSVIFSMEKKRKGDFGQEREVKKLKSFDARAELHENPRAFHEACKNGDIKKVQAFIDAKIAVNIPFPDEPYKGQSQFVFAICCNNESVGIEILKLLLANDLDVDCCDANNNTPVQIAIRCGKTEVVKFLLDSGANADVLNKAVNDHKDTCIDLAVTRGHLDALKLLLERQLFDLNAVNLLGNTPLKLAVGSGKAEVVKFLLNSGVNADVLSGGLFEAIKKENESFIKVFLDRGANIGYWNARLETPLIYALRNNNYKIVKLLLFHSKPQKNHSQPKKKKKVQTLLGMCSSYVAENFKKCERPSIVDIPEDCKVKILESISFCSESIKKEIEDLITSPDCSDETKSIFKDSLNSSYFDIKKVLEGQGGISEGLKLELEELVSCKLEEPKTNESFQIAFEKQLISTLAKNRCIYLQNLLQTNILTPKRNKISRKTAMDISCDPRIRNLLVAIRNFYGLHVPDKIKLLTYKQFIGHS